MTKEIDDIRIEGIRQLLEDGNGRGSQAHVRGGLHRFDRYRHGGKSPLGEAALDSKSPEIPRHKCLRPHVERRALCSSLNHGL